MQHRHHDVLWVEVFLGNIAEPGRELVYPTRATSGIGALNGRCGLPRRRRDSSTLNEGV